MVQERRHWERTVGWTAHRTGRPDDGQTGVVTESAISMRESTSVQLLEQVMLPHPFWRYFQLFRRRPFAFLLDSAGQQDGTGAYSFAGADPTSVYGRAGDCVGIPGGVRSCTPPSVDTTVDPPRRRSWATRSASCAAFWRICVQTGCHPAKDRRRSSVERSATSGTKPATSSRNSSSQHRRPSVAGDPLRSLRLRPRSRARVERNLCRGPRSRSGRAGGPPERRAPARQMSNRARRVRRAVAWAGPRSGEQDSERRFATHSRPFRPCELRGRGRPVQGAYRPWGCLRDLPHAPPPGALSSSSHRLGVIGRRRSPAT